MELVKDINHSVSMPRCMRTLTFAIFEAQVSLSVDVT